MDIKNKPLKLSIYSFILLAWAGSLVYLFSRNHIPDFTNSKAFSSIKKTGLSPISQWMGLYIGNKKIGYEYQQVVPQKNGFVFRERMFMRIMLMGHEKTITTIVDSATDKDYFLRHISFSLKTSGMEMAAVGTVKGNILLLNLHGIGGNTQERYTFKKPVLSSDGIILKIVKDGFSRSEYHFHIFDPTVQQELPVNVRILGKAVKTVLNNPVDTYKLEVTIKDMKETMYITPQGETVEEISPLGFRAVLEPKYMALTKGWGGENVDLISATAIKAQGLTVTYPAQVTHMYAYMSGMSKDELLPSIGFQTVQSRLVDISATTHIGTYKLPYRITKNSPLSINNALNSNSIINADNPDIIALAKSILHGETDAKKAVELINQWVYTHVKDNFTVMIPRSIDLLKNPEGDCKAHTILFTALARAAGVPTKMAMGVVLMSDGYFYYHAWPLVYLDGWVPVDPTFGEFPADATHIILATGNLTNWMDILGVVGRLQIDVMKIQTNR